jgi:prepilin-type N-terminal cleavage/methylation domain-containing protein
MLKRKGFNITELIVVVTIIAGLIAILIPALGSARAIAFKVFCKNNLKQLGICVQSYAMESKVYPVCVPDSNLTMDDFIADPQIAKDRMLGVPISLWPYHKQRSLYDCPMLFRQRAEISYCYDSRAGREFEKGEDIYSTFKKPVNISVYLPPVDKSKKDYYYLTPDRVKKPERFVILYDLPAVKQPLTTAPKLYQNIDPDDYASYNDDVEDANGYLWDYDGHQVNGPHRTGFNILFADLQVEWFRTFDAKKITRNPN